MTVPHHPHDQVRCIKPNSSKVPKQWEDEMVSKQLKCSGIMEAVRVIAAGYPDRVPHSEILGRFAALITPEQRPSADKDGEKAAASKVAPHHSSITHRPLIDHSSTTQSPP